MLNSVIKNIGGKEIIIETGKLAKQADGAVIAKCGNNIVLVTVVSSKEDSDLDFFPLTCEYQEKFYSTGKIPGGYFKREGKPTTDATLAARLMDRPIRPKFPSDYKRETQVIATVLSSDGNFPVEILASLGASAAFHISDIPFDGPTAAVVVGRVNGNFLLNPDSEELEKSDVALTVAGAKSGIVMVEGESKFLSEKEILEVLKFAYDNLFAFFEMQDELRTKCGNPIKRQYNSFRVSPAIEDEVRNFVTPKLEESLRITSKADRYRSFDSIKKEIADKFLQNLSSEEETKLRKKEVNFVFDEVKYQSARNMILQEQKRIDGRRMDEVRKIECETSLLPRTHGSGLFTRGETQVLGTVTLGTGDDEQMIDSLQGMYRKRFLLHYNFPPFCVGEVGRVGFQSRREIGHGNLAERAIKAILPEFDKFPYTVRIVSEVLESNGSSSMGTVCSGMLALLDAGIPVKDNVAGIAMGLIKEDDNVVVLSDILGDEDHLGDMDFKVAGTRKGITALQMDIKVDGINFEILEKALMQAKEGRNFILDEMEKVLANPRGELSKYAPRIETIKIKPEKVREVIGAGGKIIRGIIEETGVKIDIEDDGTINIASNDSIMLEKAKDIIKQICVEPELDKVYKGKVVKITDFGAFVEILPNVQGLLHISEIALNRIKKVSDEIKEGEEISVKVIDIDRSGKLKLSRKALLKN